MRPFVAHDSIVRRIWGDADTVLFVFAGSAAEFALNRAVDWLFFTGAIPGDPIGRLFSTARFGQEIVFADGATARATLERINAIHGAVEASRGARIPEWAHRDVLYMLIDYSERAFETLHRPLTPAERDDLYDVFHRVGLGLHVRELPATYDAWREDRVRHLERDLAYGELTAALYARYREELGAFRYGLLLEIQALLVPPQVRALLETKPGPWMRFAVPAYRAAVKVGLKPLVQRLLLPFRYLEDVRRLERGNERRAG